MPRSGEAELNLLLLLAQIMKFGKIWRDVCENDVFPIVENVEVHMLK